MNEEMKTFGLTGGVGMGKSTAAEWLRQRGIPVVDSDQLARDIVEPGQPALEEIHRAFGNDVMGADGRLRRDQLARLVFGNAAARQVLESITHPRIHELWARQLQEWAAERRPLAVAV